MDQDATWCGGRPRPGHIVLDGEPVPPKRDSPFLAISVVAKRSPISATAEHLLKVLYLLKALRGQYLKTQHMERTKFIRMNTSQS